MKFNKLPFVAVFLFCYLFGGVAEARWYEAQNGRFISADPEQGKIDKPATLNKYAYAESDPVNKLDPSGRMTMTEEIVTMDESELEQAGVSENQISNLNNIVKNLCKTTSEIGGTVGKIAEHHALPKFAGGRQNAAAYADIPEPLHEAVHRLIEIAFTINGFMPPNRGRVAFNTLFQNKAVKLKYLEVIRDVAGYVDKACKLEQANVQPIQPVFDDIVNVYKDFDF